MSTNQELNRYKEALKVAMHAYSGAASWHVEQTDRAIEAILNPPAVVMEEVEVVRWAVIAPSGYVEMTCSSEEIANKEVSSDGRYPCYQVAKLTGTIKRPKPQPVERTVSVPCRITGYPDDEIIGKPINLHSGERFYAFAEEDECHGKTGFLSFTWTEDPK